MLKSYLLFFYIIKKLPGGSVMSSPEQPPRRQYVNFTFYKIDPAWRRLPEDERTRGKQEFLRAVEEYQGKVLVIAYTTVGIRGWT